MDTPFDIDLACVDIVLNFYGRTPIRLDQACVVKEISLVLVVCSQSYMYIIHFLFIYDVELKRLEWLESVVVSPQFNCDWVNFVRFDES